MPWLYLISYRRHITVISDFHLSIEPFVEEVLPPLLPTERAGEGYCGVTGKDLKS